MKKTRQNKKLEPGSDSIRTEQALMKLFFAPAQLFHQLLQMGWERGFGTHVLLQPFADGVADRPRSLVVDWFEIAVDSAIHHDPWRVPRVAFQLCKVKS